MIDTPGIRSLQVSDLADGLDVLFAEITELAARCRFRDCTHAHEPGCAVRVAVTEGTVDPRRLERRHRLQAKNAPNDRTKPPGAGGQASGNRSKRR